MLLPLRSNLIVIWEVHTQIIERFVIWFLAVLLYSLHYRVGIHWALGGGEALHFCANNVGTAQYMKFLTISWRCDKFLT